MCEFAPARVRREAQGSRANRTLARPSCPAPMVLATFAETKVARAAGRRGRDMDVVRKFRRATGSRLSSLIKARPSMAALRVAGMTSLETLGYNQLPYRRMYTRF